MNWFIDYVVIAMVAAAGASAVADRFRAGAGGVAALVTGLAWPVVIVGSGQLAVWMLAVELSRNAPRTLAFQAQQT